MGTLFTDDDVDKTVESADGHELGVVAAVEEGTAYVDPDPGVRDSIRAILEWEGSHDDPVPIADDAVSDLTTDTVRLEATVPAEIDRDSRADTTEPMDTDELDATESTDADELDAIEDEARRDLEVDPTELTDQDPEVELDPDEDVGRRSDARVDPEEGNGEDASD